MSKLLLIIYAFYIIYFPDFGFIHPLLGQAEIIAILSLMNITVLNKSLLNVIQKIKFDKLLMNYTIAAIYLIIRNLVANFNTSNFASNITVLFSIINFAALLLWFEKISVKKKVEKFIDFIIQIALIQSFIMILMLLIPNLHNLGKLFLTQKQSEEYFYYSVLNRRSYGIGSSYTFMLPLTQAMFAIISLLMFRTTKKSKYIYYSFILIFTSFLNGRTGLYIYLLLLLFFLLEHFLRYPSRRKIIQFSILVIVLLLFFIFNYRLMSERLTWASKGINEIIDFFVKNQRDGNVGVLVGSALFFPDSLLDICFGTGQRVFGINGINIFGKNSDIGYINDIFKGGIAYVLFMYVFQLRYLKKRLDKQHYLYISIFILLANYKGEVMTGSMLLLINFIIAGANEYFSETVVGENIIPKENTFN